MGGKASIILVLGFGAILGFLSLNMNRIANVSVSNMAMYSDMNAAHALATIGTNVGLAKFYADTGWAGSITQNIDDGTLRGRFTATRSDISANRARLRTVSTYQATPFTTLRDTIDVYFDKTKYNSFAMYAWMTNFEGNVFWITGDTVWGRIHSNGALHVNGSPVFMEKATTSKNFDPRVGSGANRAIFKNGYETGMAEIPFPNDLSELVDDAREPGTPYGKYFTSNLWVTMHQGGGAGGDGKVCITRTRMLSPMVSFAIGALLGASFLAILPHAFEMPGVDAHHVALTVLCGILVFFLLEKMVIWRHCHTDDCDVHGGAHVPDVEPGASRRDREPDPDRRWHP